MTTTNNFDIINVMKKRKTHHYREGEKVLKKWFPAEPLLKLLLKDDTTENRARFMERIGVDHARTAALLKPGHMISSDYADKYAIRAGYHPCMIWPDWFGEEPEEGSNPAWEQKKKQRAMAKDRIVYTDTTQP